MRSAGDKYLQRQTDADIVSAATAVAALLDRPWQHALVVPACNENWQALQPMLTMCQSNNSLLILVLNEPANAPGQWQQCNQDLLKQLHRDFALQPLAPGAWLDSNSNFLLLEYLGQRALNSKFGVGLARKQGNDLAALLHREGLVNNEWIGNTDADAQLPDNYFSCELPALASAALHPDQYSQTGIEPEIYRATLAYDMRLEQYRLGLLQAGSRYAYTAHGSTLKVRAGDYAAAHGFPQRAAGEDFYLLNKLQKLGGVVQLASPPVQLQPRCSDRVPFGTGPAVSRLLEFPDLQQAPLLYNPLVFERLGALLQLLQSNHPDHWQAKAESAGLGEALGQLKPAALARHLAARWQDNDQYQTHLHNWFDAFRTLKTVQHFRRSGLGDLSLAQWLQQHGEASLPAGHGQALRAAGSLPTQPDRTSL